MIRTIILLGIITGATAFFAASVVLTIRTFLSKDGSMIIPNNSKSRVLLELLISGTALVLSILLLLNFG